MKNKWTIWLVMPLFLSACSSTLSYSKTLELMLEETIDDSSDKKEAIGYYKELGGAKTSERRGRKACETLEKGTDVEALGFSLSHLEDPYEELGIRQPWSDSDYEKIKIAHHLLSAEVYAAQLAFCPETEVEIEL